MTVENIKRQLESYTKDYDMNNYIEIIQNNIEDNDLELGNIITFFIYKRNDYLEIIPFTHPESNIKIKFKRKL